MQAGLHAAARTAGGERDQLVERVHARIAVIGIGVDQHVVEQGSAAFVDLAESLDEVSPFFDRTRREVSVVGLVAEPGIDRLFVRGRVMRLFVAGLHGVGLCVRIRHVEDARLIAGDRHHHEVGQHAMALLHHVHVHAHLRVFGHRRRRMAGRDRRRLGELLIELLFEMAQAGEILIQALLVGGADGFLDRLDLVHHARQHAAARHHARARREHRRVRILEIGAVQARVELQRRNLRRVRRIGVLVAHGVAEIAGRGSRQRAEARRAADFVGDGHVDGFAGAFAATGRRLAGAADDPARVMAKVGLAVAERGQVGDQVDVLAHARHRSELLRNVVVGAGFAGHQDAVVAAEPPEPGAEAQRHRRAARIGVAAIVEEAIQQRKAHRHHTAIEHAAQYTATAQVLFDQHRSNPQCAFNSKLSERAEPTGCSSSARASAPISGRARGESCAPAFRRPCERRCSARFRAAGRAAGSRCR